MHSEVVVTLGPQQEFHLSLAGVDALDHEQARRWLDDEFMRLECEPLRASGKVLLAEFKYAGVPKETFGGWFGIDQAVPRKAFWQLKKNFFPWVYYNNLVNGTWGGPKGWLR